MEDQVTTTAAPSRLGLATGSTGLLALARTPLFTNAFFLWGNAATAAVAGFAFWVLAARLYDAEVIGVGSAALSVLTLLAMFSHLGLGLGLIRFLPESGGRGPKLANAMFTTSAAGGILSSIVFLLGIPLWAPRLDFLLEQPLYALGFISFVAISTLSVVQSQAFMAVRRAKYILAQALPIQLSRLALLVLMAAFFDAFGVLAAAGLATTIGAVAGFYLLARALPGYRPAPVIDVAAVRKFLPFATGNYIADALLLTPGLVLPLFVVNQLGSAEGAYFYIAWFLGYILTSASGFLALSLFAEGSHDPASLRVLSRNAVVGGLAVAAAGALFVLSLGDKVLLVFGHDYAREGSTLLRIVVLAALPATVVNVYLGALRVMKNVREMVLIGGVIAVATLAGAWALLPTMGLAGAGVGHLIGQGLGLTLILGRVASDGEGTLMQRLRRLLGTPVVSEARETTPEDVWTDQGQQHQGELVGIDEASSTFPRAKAESGLRVTALICTLNEEESLPHVLPRIPDWVDEVLLVDGHSTDQTVEIARALRPDIHAVSQPGKGKGDALRFGVGLATGDIIVTLDADGDSDPQEISKFVEPLLQGWDFVKGSRLAGRRPRGMSFYRWFGNKILAWTYNLLYGTRFTDVCSGYIGYWKAKFLQLELTDVPNEKGCTMEQQMIIRAMRAGMRVKEVPHTSGGRIAGASKISGLREETKQGFRAWFVLIKEYFHR